MFEFDDSRPKWPQIVAEVHKRIRERAYVPGQRITALALEREFGVTRVTMGKVMASLRRDGYVRTEHGMGSFITGKVPAPPAGTE
ncbi:MULTISPECIES: GntR family transcriptional regulator [unclassified Kitasatospora]|uniref:GntR family transcriptional regulator n=1 Tax=unclassified Kitasatospora TaxID=2633591 RepID=UPI0033D8C0F5